MSTNFVLSSTKASRLFAYFSIMTNMLSKMFDLMPLRRGRNWFRIDLKSGRWPVPG